MKLGLKCVIEVELRSESHRRTHIIRKIVDNIL